mgnify:CR=1 FL=1
MEENNYSLELFGFSGYISYNGKYYSVKFPVLHYNTIWSIYFKLEELGYPCLILLAQKFNGCCSSPLNLPDFPEFDTLEHLMDFVNYVKNQKRNI